MPKRATIIIKGKVQLAGYRSKVKQIADELGIFGYVENLEDDSVKVIAEGDENTLKKFADEIRIKNALIDVESVDIDFSSPTGDFKDFKKVVKDQKKETDERLDGAVVQLKELIELTKTGNYELKSLGNKMDNVGEKVDRSKEEIVKHIDQSGARIVEHIDWSTEQTVTHIDQSGAQMIEHMDKNFNALDEKYHIVSETLISMNTNLAGTQEQLKEVVGNLTTIVKEFVKNKNGE